MEFIYIYNLVNNSSFIFKFILDIKYKLLYSFLSTFLFLLTCLYYKNYLLFYILVDLYNQMDYVKFTYSKPYEIIFVFIELCFIFSFIITFPFNLILLRFLFFNMCTKRENNIINKLLIYFFLSLFIFVLLLTKYLLPYLLLFYNSYNFDSDYIYLQQDSRFIDILDFYLTWFLFTFLNSIMFLMYYIAFVFKDYLNLKFLIKWKVRISFIFTLILISFGFDLNWILNLLILNLLMFELINFLIIWKLHIKSFKINPK